MHGDADEQRRILERHGGRFTGASWMLMMETTEPLEEVVLAAACPPAVVSRSEGKATGLQARMYETEHGPVLHVLLSLYDRPAQPYVIDLLVNPAPGGGGDMVRRLAGQDTLQVLFYSARSGKPLRRRILALDSGTRRGLDMVWRQASAVQTNVTSWERAVASIEHLRL